MNVICMTCHPFFCFFHIKGCLGWIDLLVLHLKIPKRLLLNYYQNVFELFVKQYMGLVIIVKKLTLF